MILQFRLHVPYDTPKYGYDMQERAGVDAIKMYKYGVQVRYSWSRAGVGAVKKNMVLIGYDMQSAYRCLFRLWSKYDSAMCGCCIPGECGCGCHKKIWIWWGCGYGCDRKNWWCGCGVNITLWCWCRFPKVRVWQGTMSGGTLFIISYIFTKLNEIS